MYGSIDLVVVWVVEIDLVLVCVLSYGLGRPVISSEIGNWSVFVLLGWRFVLGNIIKGDGREPRIV